MRLVFYIERLIFHASRVLALGVFVLMLLICTIILLRSVFKINVIAMQEAVFYIHSLLFMLGMAFTLQADQHVRVDVFYTKFNTRQKAWVNALGHIVILVPLCVFILLNSFDYVYQAWLVREGSSDAGGIGYVYLLKTLIPLMAFSLLLQAFATLIKEAHTLVYKRHA